MAERLNANEIHAAKRLAERLEELLRGPTRLHDAVNTARVLAETLEVRLVELEEESVDFPLDRLKSLRNLSKNLDENAARAREAVSMLVLTVLEEQGHLVNAQSTPAGVDHDIERKALTTELLAEIVNELDAGLHDSQSRRKTDHMLGCPGPDPNQPIIGNCATHIYHVSTGAWYHSVSQANRVEFSSTEAAELAGYRRAKF